MNFCSDCGVAVIVQIPAGDNRPRHVCPSCATIHYQNPKIVAGCIAEWEGKILLCKRAIEPRHGLWTLPAGFMENNETTLEAALRETREEACAEVNIEGLYALFNLPHINQVYMMFRGSLAAMEFAPGEESLQVELYDEADIPWDELAFATIKHTLRFYFEDRKSACFPLHMGDIVKQDGRFVGFAERREA